MTLIALMYNKSEALSLNELKKVPQYFFYNCLISNTDYSLLKLNIYFNSISRHFSSFYQINRYLESLFGKVTRVVKSTQIENFKYGGSGIPDHVLGALFLKFIINYAQ